MVEKRQGDAGRPAGIDVERAGQAIGVGDAADDEAGPQRMHQPARAAADLEQGQQHQHQRGVFGEVSEHAGHATEPRVAAIADADAGPHALADHQHRQHHTQQAGQGGIEGGDERQGLALPSK